MFWDEINLRQTDDQFTKLSIRDGSQLQVEVPLFMVPSTNLHRPVTEMDRNEEWPADEWMRIMALLQGAAHTAHLAGCLALEEMPRPEFN